MKLNRVIACVLAVLLTAIGLTAWASQTGEPGAEDSVTVPEKPVWKAHEPLTDEQKAEMEAGREKFKAEIEARQKQWGGLADDQKSQIFDLWDDVRAANEKVIDKYLEMGLIDQATADAMKEGLKELAESGRENERMPGLGMRNRKDTGRPKRTAPGDNTAMNTLPGGNDAQAA